MKDDKTKEGADLWRKAQSCWAEPEAAVPAAPDPLLLAAYLDGRLSQAEAALVESRMTANPRLLDEVLALKAELAETPVAAPAAAVARAQALRGGGLESPAVPVIDSEEQSDFLSHLLGGWLRPAVPAFAVVAVVLACAGAFELGRYQSERILPQQTAGSDAGDPFTLEELI
ncbi:hypothetical protein [Pelagibius sp.]|uniref:hypothetical protein n=1 Tax=Pelagibius sp. TaxID=1931238 RepID=UPI003BAF7E09